MNCYQDQQPPQPVAKRLRPVELHGSISRRCVLCGLQLCRCAWVHATVQQLELAGWQTKQLDKQLPTLLFVMLLCDLIMARDIKLPPPPSQTAIQDDPLSGSLRSSSTGSQPQLAVVPPTPSMSSRPSVALLSSRGAAAEAWAASPHGGIGTPNTGQSAAGSAPGWSAAGVAAAASAAGGANTPGGASGLKGAAGASVAGAGLNSTPGLGGLSRRPSSQLQSDMGSRQSSFVSMVRDSAGWLWYSQATRSQHPII